MLLPEAFEDPADYVLQKSLGVNVLHAIFPDVHALVLKQKMDPTTPQSYAEVLKEPFDALALGEQNREGEMVTGSDYWAVGPSGVAGSYSSSAGRRRMINLLKNPIESKLNS